VLGASVHGIIASSSALEHGCTRLPSPSIPSVTTPTNTTQSGAVAEGGKGLAAGTSSECDVIGRVCVWTIPTPEERFED